MLAGAVTQPQKIELTLFEKVHRVCQTRFAGMQQMQTADKTRYLGYSR